MRIIIQGRSIASINNKDSDDTKLSFAITYMVLLLFITNAAAFLEKLFGGVTHQNVSLFVWVTLFLVLVYNVLAIIRNLKIKTILFSLFSIFLFLVNYLIIGNDVNFINVASRFFLTVFPIVLVASSINNYEYLIVQLIKVSKIIIPVAAVLLLFSINQSQDYRMGLSYSLQLPVLMILYNYYRTKKITNIFYALAGILTILMLGARGPLLGILFYGGLLLLKTFDVRKNALKTICCIFSVLFFVLISNYIFESLFNFIQAYGLRSRTLYLLTNDVFHDSGRNSIYSVLIEEILNNPFTIRGIAGEYAFTGGLYAHNFILELLFDFGVVFGGLAILYVFYQAFKTVRNFLNYGNANDSINLILLSSSFFSALVSGTIWTSVYFWVWLLMKKGSLVKSSK